MKTSFYSNNFFTTVLMLILLACCTSLTAANTVPNTTQKDLAALESSFDGRIGIYALNTENNKTIQYRATERFPIQSTFKVVLVAAILKKSTTENDLLQRKVNYTKNDLVFWSPVTEKHVSDGMTISDLCAATIKYSDNTAANLLMKQLGGPQAVTDFAHALGDKEFRIDGWEAELNSNPNDSHDTSTPKNMGINLQKLVIQNILTNPQRQQLTEWMKENTTGDTKIRAGVPKDWIVADKTGGGNSYGVANDIAIIWPPHASPIIVAIYTVQNKENATRHDEIIASATRILTQSFKQ